MLTVIVPQGQSVEIHTEEGSFIVQHTKKNLSVRCSEECKPDDLGRHKVLYQKANSIEEMPIKGAIANTNMSTSVNENPAIQQQPPVQQSATQQTHRGPQ